MRKLSAVCVLAGLFVAGAAAAEEAAAPKALEVTADTFRCITEMTKVKHYFVDNLLGNLDETVKVAQSTTGGVFPAGTVLQLVPTEVMIKQPAGFSPVTRDWEFFELDVSPEGQSIRTRGFVNVNNRFGGNCFGCHVAAKPEFDFVCELDHGCAPIPVTRAMITALQNTDPRCKNAPPPSAEDLEALQQLQALSAPPAEKAAPQ